MMPTLTKNGELLIYKHSPNRPAPTGGGLSTSLPTFLTSDPITALWLKQIGMRLLEARKAPNGAVTFWRFVNDQGQVQKALKLNPVPPELRRLAGRK